MGNFTKSELPYIEEFNSGTKEPVQTTIWTEDGVLLGKLEAENRHPITIEELGKSRVADATVAIEDHRFYEHPGVDVWGIGRDAFSSSTSSPLWTLLLALTYAVFGVGAAAPIVFNVVAGTLILATPNDAFGLICLLTVVFPFEARWPS